MNYRLINLHDALWFTGYFHTPLQPKSPGRNMGTFQVDLNVQNQTDASGYSLNISRKYCLCLYFSIRKDMLESSFQKLVGKSASKYHKRP